MNYLRKTQQLIRRHNVCLNTTLCRLYFRLYFYTTSTYFFYKRFLPIRQRIPAETSQKVRDLLLWDMSNITVYIHSYIYHKKMIMSRLPFSYNQVADMRTVQDPLGYADLRTTQICTQTLQRGGHSVVSRLSKL